MIKFSIAEALANHCKVLFVVSNSPRLVELNLNFFSVLTFFTFSTFFLLFLFLLSLEQSQNKQANKIFCIFNAVEVEWKTYVVYTYIFNFHKSKLIEKLIGISSKTASEFTVFSPCTIPYILYTIYTQTTIPHTSL